MERGELGSISISICDLKRLSRRWVLPEAKPTAEIGRGVRCRSHRLGDATDEVVEELHSASTGGACEAFLNNAPGAAREESSQTPEKRDKSRPVGWIS